MTQKAALSENRVLVVDDDASTTLLLKKVLDTENSQVDTANSAAVAMNLINKQKYHVVITDIMMPDKDGLALLEDLRKRDPLIQVVIMTGGVSMSRTLSALEHGAADFILKPINVEELIMIVRLCAAKLERWRGILRASAHQQSAAKA